MRVIVVRIGNMNAYPPSINLINALIDLGHEVIVCTTRDSQGLEKSIPFETHIDYIDIDYLRTSLYRRMINQQWIKKQIYRTIDKYYTANTIVWLEDDVTIKHTSYDIEKYNFIIRLDELNEGLYYTQHVRNKLFSMDASRVGNAALAVVVPEYNRAHMLKVWWKLEKLPYILPNKPYDSVSNNGQMTDDELPQNALKTIQEIGDRKIILYQGKMHPERPVEPFIEAVQDMKDYAFVVNAGTSNDVEKKYRNCYHIGFVPPPFHLQITKHAHIGIVAYIPGIGTDSVLNALYCAPNKIYEYGSYGVPFISNDLPPLKYLYDVYHCGLTVDLNNIDDIREKIKMIDVDYDSFSKQVRIMNDAVDYKELVNQLMIKVANKKIEFR